MGEELEALTPALLAQTKWQSWTQVLPHVMGPGLGMPSGRGTLLGLRGLPGGHGIWLKGTDS